MNPTGNTTADMIFTGAILVFNLAALAGLGYMLWRLAGDRRAKTAEAAATWWEQRTKESEQALELCRSERNRAKVEAMRDVRNEIREAVNRLSDLRQEVEYQRSLLVRAHRHVPIANLLWSEIHMAIKTPTRASYLPTEDTGEPD